MKRCIQLFLLTCTSIGQVKYMYKKNGCPLQILVCPVFFNLFFFNIFDFDNYLPTILRNHLVCLNLKRLTTCTSYFTFILCMCIFTDHRQTLKLFQNLLIIFLKTIFVHGQLIWKNINLYRVHNVLRLETWDIWFKHLWVIREMVYLHH